MTLGQLFDRIDWSAYDEAEKEMEARCGKKFNTDPDFKKRFKCALIESALYDEGPKKDEAIRFLLPVWPQIVQITKELGLWKEPLITKKS